MKFETDDDPRTEREIRASQREDELRAVWMDLKAQADHAFREMCKADGAGDDELWQQWKDDRDALHTAREAAFKAYMECSGDTE